MEQDVACLRLKTDAISKGYLFHILNSDYFEQRCIQASKGVAQKNMSTEWLKEFEIKGFVPPIDLQDKFEAFVAQVDKSKFEKLVELINHITALMTSHKETYTCQTLNS